MINLTLLCFSSDQMSNGFMATLPPRENQCTGYNSCDIAGSQTHAWNIPSLRMTVDGCRENGLMMETFSDCVWGVLVGQLLYGQASAIGCLKGLLPLQGAKARFLLSEATELSHRSVVPLWLCREFHFLASDHSLLCAESSACSDTCLPHQFIRSPMDTAPPGLPKYLSAQPTGTR